MTTESMVFWVATPCSSERACLTFQRDISPPPSGSKSDSSKKPADAGGKLSSACHLLLLPLISCLTELKTEAIWLFIVTIIRTSDPT
jgi:hypothetical protein